VVLGLTCPTEHRFGKRSFFMHPGVEVHILAKGLVYDLGHIRFVFRA